MKQIINNEAVQHLDDLIIRRTTLGENIGRAMAVAPLIAQLFVWDTNRREQEVERLRTYFMQRTPFPKYLQAYFDETTLSLQDLSRE